MFKAILVVYIGVFGQPNPGSDLALVIPVPSVEACQVGKKEMLEVIKKDAPLGAAYLAECLDASYLKVVGNQS